MIYDLNFLIYAVFATPNFFQSYSIRQHEKLINFALWKVGNGKGLSKETTGVASEMPVSRLLAKSLYSLGLPPFMLNLRWCCLVSRMPFRPIRKAGPYLRRHLQRIPWPFGNSNSQLPFINRGWGREANQPRWDYNISYFDTFRAGVKLSWPSFALF